MASNNLDQQQHTGKKISLKVVIKKKKDIIKGCESFLDQKKRLPIIFILFLKWAKRSYCKSKVDGIFLSQR